MFYLGYTKCFDEFFWRYRLNSTTRFFKFFECTLRSIVPTCLERFAFFEFCKSRFFKVVGKPESSPWIRHLLFCSRIWYPHNKRMLESRCFFNSFYIGLIGYALKFYDSKEISKYFFLPGKLWRMTEIKNREATRFKVFSVGRRCGTMVEKILWIIFFFGKEVHRGSISGIIEEYKGFIFFCFFPCRIFLFCSRVFS